MTTELPVHKLIEQFKQVLDNYSLMIWANMDQSDREEFIAIAQSEGVAAMVAAFVDCIE